MNVSRPAASAAALVVAMSIVSCSHDSGDAAPVSVQEAASYSGADRQEFLEKCAANEGSLSVYTAQNSDLWEALKEGFEKKYPGITVEVTRRTSAQTAEALNEETKAKVYKADVANVKVEVAESLLDLFAPFESPELDAFNDNAIGPDGKLVISDEIPYGVVYNTDKIVDPPKNSRDLLDPRFKGEIAMSTTLLGTQWVGLMDTKYGEDFIKDFGQQDIHTTDANGNAILAQVAAGSPAMGVALDYASVQALITGGKPAPIEWLPIDAYWTQGALSLVATAPHPCAAMLYIDFELSKEGQAVNPLYLSARDDVPRPDAISGIDPVDVWGIVGEHGAAAYQAAHQRWTQLIDQYIIK